MNEREQELAQLNEEVRTCPLCPLAKTRTNAVPGEGPIDAEIMLIGEAPGFHEDKQGRPFVGQSGRFLEELLRSAGLSREQVYITNVVKCRPPENRDPAPREIAACAPYLDRQLAIIDPKIVITLGRHSMARYFPGQSISKIHGKPKREGDRVIFPMFHPAAGLRSAEVAALIREDMLKVPALLEELRASAATTPEPVPDEGPQQLSLF
ncbi:MAG: phage polymerase-related protein [Chloroflexi bacterium]|nr:phage polymerase-related protein [Chloroflexota bacterium]